LAGIKNFSVGYVLEGIGSIVMDTNFPPVFARFIPGFLVRGITLASQSSNSIVPGKPKALIVDALLLCSYDRVVNAGLFIQICKHSG